MIEGLAREIGRSPRLRVMAAPLLGLLRRLVGDPCWCETMRFRELCADVSRGVAAPVFVKVGAHDGVTMDPLAEVVAADPRWRGVLIEPVHRLFERLRSNFGDAARFRLLNIAIGAEAGERDFYYVDPSAPDAIPGLPDWFDQVNSFDRGHIVRMLGPGIEPHIRSVRARVRPLRQTLAEHGAEGPVVLQIDAEGFDFEALKTADLTERPPAIIFVEHKHLSETDRAAMRSTLRAAGYRVRDNGGDFIAAHSRTVRRLAPWRAKRVPDVGAS